MINKEDAMCLLNGTILHHVVILGSDKQPVRCRVNGKCKTWVTRPSNFRLPVKHGLRNCFYIDQNNSDEWYY